MKDKAKVIVLLIIFIGILIGAVMVSNKGTDSPEALNQVALKDNSNSIKENENVNLISDVNNNYEKEVAIEVDNSNFKEEVLESDKKVLIDFYATWCGPCKILSPILEEVARERDDIKLVKIDVDKNQRLSMVYGISAMPTLVVIDNQKEVNRSVGVISKEMVIELIDK